MPVSLNTVTENDSLMKLYRLGSDAKIKQTIPLWQFNTIERGALTAIYRYGHGAAAGMMSKAGFPIRSAVRLVRIAFQHGYQYRKPLPVRPIKKA